MNRIAFFWQKEASTPLSPSTSGKQLHWRKRSIILYTSTTIFCSVTKKNHPPSAFSLSLGISSTLLRTCSYIKILLPFYVYIYLKASLQNPSGVTRTIGRFPALHIITALLNSQSPLHLIPGSEGRIRCIWVQNLTRAALEENKPINGNPFFCFS